MDGKDENIGWKNFRDVDKLPQSLRTKTINDKKFEDQNTWFIHL